MYITSSTCTLHVCKQRAEEQPIAFTIRKERMAATTACKLHGSWLLTATDSSQAVRPRV